MPGGNSRAALANLVGQFARGGRIAAPLAAMFGFVADVLNPLGPINGILFTASLLAFLVLVYRFQGHRRSGTLDMSRKVPERALVFTSFLLVGFGLWFALQWVAAAGNRGVVADHVASIATLQDSLVGMRKDVAEVARVTKAVQADTEAIRRDTGSIEATTDELRRSSADIARNTASVAESTAAMAEGLTQLSDRISRVDGGGLIADPASPADYYHNARLQELSGRFRDAFESYRHYVGFDEEFIDPCLSYLELVRAQQGHEAAEAEFAALAARSPGNRAIRLARLSSGAGATRRQVLEQFVEEHPDFGPGYWLAAREYSIDVLRTQSSIAVEREKTLLESLRRLNETGGFARWFLDKRRAAELVQSACTRLNEIETRQLGVRVSLGEEGEDEWYRREWRVVHITGLTVSIHDGYARTVLFRIGDEAWTPVPERTVRRINERLSYVHWDVGAIPLSWQERLMNDPDAEMVLWIKYRDVGGLESPPIQICRIRSFRDGFQCRSGACPP